MNDLVARQAELANQMAEGVGDASETYWLAPQEMSFEEWHAIGQTFQQINKSINWWIGDWLNAGEMRFGEMAMQAVQTTGRGVESLLKCKAVSSRFHPRQRFEELSWTHHLSVAYMDPEDRQEWLGLALRFDLSSRDLAIVSRLDATKRQRLIDAAEEDLSSDEFRQMIATLKTDRLLSGPTTINGTATHLNGSTPSRYADDDDEDEDEVDENDPNLPFDDEGEMDAYDWSLGEEDEGDEEEYDIFEADPETVFAYFDAFGVPLKACHSQEAIWQGLAVRAHLDTAGRPVLIWEQVP